MLNLIVKNFFCNSFFGIHIMTPVDTLVQFLIKNKLYGSYQRIVIVLEQGTPFHPVFSSHLGCRLAAGLAEIASWEFQTRLVTADTNPEFCSVASYAEWTVRRPRSIVMYSLATPWQHLPRGEREACCVYQVIPLYIERAHQIFVPHRPSTCWTKFVFPCAVARSIQFV